MKTTVEKYMIPNSFDLLIMSGNVAAINEMILRKEIALADALENVDFLTERKMLQHADNEQIRINLLTKDIRKLQEALNKVTKQIKKNRSITENILTIKKQKK